MRIIIGFIIVAISIFLFGWWGLLSLLFALPFIGWKDRHKGPFPTNQSQAQMTDYNAAQDIAASTPKSFRLMQDILVKTKKSTSTDDLLPIVSQLLDTLRTEKSNVETLGDRKLLSEFLREFSITFPNWQDEYTFLTKVIENNF